MIDPVGVLKGLVEFGGFLLLAQGGIYLLSLGAHERNPVYRAVRFLTAPLTWLARRIAPAAVSERHLPLVAFFVLFWIWVLVFDGIRLMPRAPVL